MKHKHTFQAKKKKKKLVLNDKTIDIFEKVKEKQFLMR